MWFLQTTSIRPHAAFSVPPGYARNTGDITSAEDVILCDIFIRWVCPRRVANSGIFLEGATPEPGGSPPPAQVEAHPSGGWLGQSPMIWPGFSSACVSVFGTKISNAFDKHCDDDGIALVKARVEAKNLRKVDRSQGSHLA